MGKLVWKDVSSWSKGEVDRTPKSWQLDLIPKLFITRHRDHAPEAWVLFFDPYVSSRGYELSARDITLAKKEAVDFAKKAIKWSLAKLESVEDDEVTI